MHCIVSEELSVYGPTFPKIAVQKEPTILRTPGNANLNSENHITIPPRPAT